MAITVGTDTYVSVADADIYFAHAIHGAAWAAAITATKENALVTATRMLDRQGWVGSRTVLTSAQKLDWPRTGVSDPDGNAILDSAVPQFILDGCCELALALINDASVQSSADQSQNIRSLSAGSASIAYFRPVGGPRFPTIINELLGYYMRSTSDVLSPFVSGAEVETRLKSYELDRGF